MTYLGNSAFYDCTNLASVVLPSNLTRLTEGSVFSGCPIRRLELPACFENAAYYSLNKTQGFRFLGNRPNWDVNYANRGTATLFEFPATNTTWNAGKINNYQNASYKGFVGPIATMGATKCFFWTNANETVTFAYAEDALGATVTIPEGVISWGGVDWEIVGFEADAFAGQETTTVYYPILEYAKWEQVTPPAGITLAPEPGTYFTLTFHTNGGDSYPSMTFPPSATRALPSAKPTKSGHKFIGWATTADGSPVYQAGDDYTAGAAGASATLYAKWQEVGNYKIVFQPGCQFSYYVTNMPENIVAAVGTTPTIPNVIPMREGWTFSHWEHDGDAYYPGEVFTEEVEKDTTFSLGAKWNETTVYNLSEADGYGSVWGYYRTGDAVFVNKVTPGPYVETLTLPEGLHGSTSVTKASGFELPEKVNGLWWHFTIVTDKVRITGYTGTVPANLVIPSQLGGKDVVCFQGQSQFCGISTLVSVKFPATFTEIYRYDFENCPNLETVILNEGLTSINDSFRSNPKLKEIDFPSTLANWHNSYSFSGSGTSDRGYDAKGFRYADTAHRFVIDRDKSVVGEVVIPDGVVDAMMSVFTYDTKMTSCVVPEGFVLYGNMFYGSTLTTVSIPRSIQRRHDSNRAETTTITNVLVRGGAPSWDLKSYFTGLKTISYYANFAEDWADYKDLHTDVNYVELIGVETTGLYLKYDLVEDLGIVIDADYLAGDKVTLKVEGLAKGLKLVTTPIYVDPTAKKKVIKDYTYTIEGVPTETIDYEKNPMFARVTVTKGKMKTETLQPLVLSIVTPEPEALKAGVLNTDYAPVDIATLWPAVADAKTNPKDWAFKTWPAGLSLKNGELGGKPTKAGAYPVTATHKRVLEDGKTTVSETYSATMTIWGDDGVKDFRYTDQAYVETVTKTLTGVTGVSGQPTGIKFEKNTGKLSGMPTNPGVYATTLTYSDRTKKTFLWKVTEGENAGFLSTMNWTVKDSAVTVMQGVIQTNWTCNLPTDAKVTAKLPAGLVLAQDKTTKAWSLSGTPTTVGNNVVTFTTVRNGVTVTERISIIVTENERAGSWYSIQYGDQVASLMAEVTVSANGTVKLVYTEGMTNVTTKGVVSQVTKTTVTVKNLDANGTTATLVLPKDKKNPDSVDRTCVVDFENRKVFVAGVHLLYIYEKASSYTVSDVTTAVLEEVNGAETNAYAYVTLTYNAKTATFAVTGKLWDGTAIKGTVNALVWNGYLSPLLVIDKAKNAVVISLGIDECDNEVSVEIFENGKHIEIGKSGYFPWMDSFAAAELKSKKFNQLTDHHQLVVQQEDSSEVTLDIQQKSLATAVSAQGLVKFTLADADGWKWVCELLPIDNGGETQFRGIATGTKKGAATLYCPVWSK